MDRYFINTVISEKGSMTQRLKRHAETLCFLSKKPRFTKGVIGQADNDLLDCLRVCCKNTLDGNVPLSSSQRSKLKRHKNTLRELTKPRLSRARQRALLQKGGFLPALLAPILALAAPLLKNLFS